MVRLRRCVDIGLVLVLVLVQLLVKKTCSLKSDDANTNISRANFPKGFTFGTASAAYQVSSFFFIFDDFYSTVSYSKTDYFNLTSI